MLGNHGGQLDYMRRELGFWADVADASHNKESVLDRSIEEVLYVVAVPQITSLAFANAPGCSDVGLVTSGAGGLGHRELIDTGDVPKPCVHTARLGIHEGVAEVIGRSQEHVPLGSAEELLVAREVPGVDFLASFKIKIRALVVDLVGDVFGVHDDLESVCLFYLVMNMVMNMVFGPLICLFCYPGKMTKIIYYTILYS